MKEFLTTLIGHEDFWVYVILIILIINTFIILRSMNKESKKTDLMYKILSEAGKRNTESIETNTESIETNRESAEANAESNRQSIETNRESAEANKK